MMKTKLVDFSKYSSIKVGQKTEVTLLQNAEDYDNSYYLLGSCNNTLIGTNPPPLMMLDKKYDFIKVIDNTLIIGGATPSGKIASFCKKNNIANFELVSHLPGTLGGLVYMNAGLKEYEIFEHLISITTCERTMQKDEIDFGYRYTNISSPILEVCFELEEGFDTDKVAMFKKMRSNQPSTPSAGSCFKNPKSDYAGRLIDVVGLKGERIGDMAFSDVHANFLVNHGNGTFQEAIELIQKAQNKVYEAFHIWLEMEVIVLDRDYMGGDSPLIQPKSAS